MPRSNADLTLGVLRRLASPLQTVLFALFGARVARQQPRLAQHGPQRLVGLDERAGERVRNRASLARDSAAGHLGADGELRAADRAKRLRRDVLQRGARQVNLKRAAVYGDLAVARREQDARDRGLAPPDGGYLITLRHCG